MVKSCETFRLWSLHCCALNLTVRAKIVTLLLKNWTSNICEAIKRNESYVGNFDFEIHPIVVWNSLCILLFSATQNCLYLWNHKSDFDEIFSKRKLSECFQKLTTKQKFDSARHKTQFAWSHHICSVQIQWGFSDALPFYSTGSWGSALSGSAAGDLRQSEWPLISCDLETCVKLERVYSEYYRWKNKQTYITIHCTQSHNS